MLTTEAIKIVKTMATSINLIPETMEGRALLKLIHIAEDYAKQETYDCYIGDNYEE